MDGIIQEITEQTYLSGSLLWESLFRFGNSELTMAYSNLNKPPQPDLTPFEKGNVVFQILGSAAKTFTELKSIEYQRDDIYRLIQQDILNQIRKGDLIPFGFKEPRDLNDKPVKIPADLFFIGKINWENSELEYQKYEFKGVRLLADLMSVINVQAIPLNNENNKLDDLNSGQLKLPDKTKNKTYLKLEKPKKQHFSDLDPALHIDEKKAAEYLGISHKTLQGYRTKGGGPPFIKVGERSVRYKIADLMNWAENRKRKNTSG